MGTLGNNVILLHGWTYSIDKWDPFVNFLKLKGMTPVLLKIPGLTDKISKPWSINDYVDWLKKTTNKTNDKLILIGHSNGGRIALNFTIKYPERVSHLILIDSAGIYHDDLLTKTKRFMFKKIAKLGKKITKSGKLKNIFYKIAGESDYKNADPNMKKTMLNLIESDKLVNFGKIKTNTTIIWGEKDRITPISDGQKLNKLIKDSKFYVIKDSNHSPQFSNPFEVSDIISGEI